MNVVGVKICFDGPVRIVILSLARSGTPDFIYSPSDTPQGPGGVILCSKPD